MCYRRVSPCYLLQIVREVLTTGFAVNLFDCSTGAVEKLCRLKGTFI